MRIVIAPDKFKGSLSAAQVCATISQGLEAALSAQGRTAEIIALPMADGGEGTVDAALAAGFAAHSFTVAGPLGSPVTARIALSAGTATAAEAVIELAEASGLRYLAAPDRDALAAHTFGTGELVRHALDLGAGRIVLAIGGSASTDGGTGMLRALGARFLDAAGDELPLGGGALTELAAINLSGLDPRIAGCEFVLASDVDNPLTGPNGAAAVFGPQKGASSADIERLDAGLAGLARVAAGTTTTAAPHGQATVPALAPGSGAAGGVGFGALAFLGAARQQGAELVGGLLGLEAALRGSGLVITGEGSFDEQSLAGKGPAWVAELAKRAGATVVLACGRLEVSPAQLDAAGIDAAYTLTAESGSAEAAHKHAKRYLKAVTRKIARHHLAVAPGDKA